jgi:hypothetical protein
MKISGNCAKCGSDKIMSDVKIVDHGHGNTKQDLSIEFYENPDALLFKGARRGTLLLSICGQCGHAELSVGNPEELWRLYQANRME